ncbi:hypothetical protein F4678DRAFT_426626 [Xylaria arbuscula]|nr:hypothetical protein F4678DRAFT_426626 [Xylaria arbuscula]
MPREGTRSATGNSRPRVFQAVDTAPAIKRTNKPKAKKPAAEPTTVKPVKPVGVTKKKTVPKKDGPVAKVGWISRFPLLLGVWNALYYQPCSHNLNPSSLLHLNVTISCHKPRMLITWIFCAMLNILFVKPCSCIDIKYRSR